MDKHEQYKRLYKKYVDGKRWLERGERKGTVTEQDRRDFNERVVEPMEKMRAAFTPEERLYWDRVRMAVELFGGTIILKDEQINNKQGG